MASITSGMTPNQTEANLTTFQGFSERSYVDILQSGYGFIFITAPALFIDQLSNDNIPYSDLAYNNLKKDPKTAGYLQNEQFNKTATEIIKMLSYNTAYKSTGFMPMFTNLCKGIDPTEVTLDASEAFQTTHGYKQSIPTNSILSRAGTQLNIPFQETAELTITKTIELWCNYIENVSDGTVTPHPNSITNGSIDYLADIYYIMMGPDGQTIKYYVRWTGCYPTNIPYSRFNYQKGDRNIVDVDITFNCIGGIEHMNPAILEEFNMASLRMNNTDSFNISGNLETTRDLTDYFNIKNSMLLKPDNLEKVSHQLASKMRNNPLIFCLDDTTTKQARFVLTFGSDSFEEDNTRFLIKNSGLANTPELLKTDDLMYGTPYATAENSTGNSSIFYEYIKSPINQSEATD